MVSVSLVILYLQFLIFTLFNKDSWNKKNSIISWKNHVVENTLNEKKNEYLMLSNDKDSSERKKIVQSIGFSKFI